MVRNNETERVYAVCNRINVKLVRFGKVNIAFRQVSDVKLVQCFTQLFSRFYHRAPVAQLVEHRAVMQEVAGSNPGRINTQDLKITEEKVLPL